MPVFASPFRRSITRLALAFCLAQIGCSNEYLVLETLGGGTAGVGAAGTAGSGGSGGENGGTDFGGASSDAGETFGGTGSDGGTSSDGGTGDGGTNSGGTSFNGGTDSGGTGGFSGGAGGFNGGNGGTAMGGEAGGPNASCATHSDCAVASLCSGFQCVGCAAAPDHCQDVCAHGFTLVSLTRNGCQVCECVPPSECAQNTDCAGGESCYAGSHCQDGCNDPSCCFGNQCSPSGCGAPPAACLEFGCSDGRECLASCDATSCECSGSTWSCQSTTGGATVASCPQACAPP